ncbi:WbqC family protein [bacterium]|nr:WbqC family protein [bacterium]
MRCAIMQPTYLPWLGYFDLMKQADIFVLLDDVKLEKSSWHVRNRIRSSQGETLLTIPVSLQGCNSETKINDTKISDTKPWRRKHLRTLEQSYSKSPFFNDFYPCLYEALSKQTPLLSEYTSNIIRQLALYFGIKTPIFLSSELSDISGVKDQRLASICKCFDADTYYSPRGSSVYLDKKNYGGALTNAGVKVVYQNFFPVEYTQNYKPFIPYLSAVDAAFNCSPNEILDLINRGCLTDWAQ